MERRDKFESYKTHPWLKKSFATLKANELEMARAFLELHSELDCGAFEFQVNRMFLDKDKPRNYRAILELLSCANSATSSD